MKSSLIVELENEAPKVGLKLIPDVELKNEGLANYVVEPIPGLRDLKHVIGDGAFGIENTCADLETRRAN
jgi:hypothetical protein